MAKNENIDIKLNIDGAAGIKSVGTMRKEIRSMSIELQELETQANKAMAMGDEATANAAKAKHAERTKEFVELKNDMKDVGAAQKYLDPGELLGGWIKLGQGAIGAVAGLAGGMKLLGVESETYKTLQEDAGTVIQTMMGLEQARQLLVDAGGIKENISLVKNTAQTIAKNAAKTAGIVISKAEVVATNAVAGAQWLLNAAMDANPVGVVILGVTALVAIFWKLYEATGSVTEALLWMVNPLGMLTKMLIENAIEQNTLTEAEKQAIMEKQHQIDMINQHIAALEKENLAINATLAGKDHVLNMLKAQGKSEKEIEDKRREYNQKEIDRAKNEENIARDKVAVAIKEGKKSTETQAQYESRLTDLKTEATKKWNAWKDKDTAEQNRKAEVDAETKQKEIEKAQEKWNEAYKKGLDARKALTEDATLNDLENQLKTAELFQDYTRMFDISLKILAEQNAKERKAIEKNYQDSKITAKGNKKELEKIEQEHKKALLNLENKYGNQIQEASDKEDKRKEEAAKAYNDKILSINLNGLDYALQNAKTYADKIRAFNDKSNEDEIQAVANYEKENADIKKKADEGNLDAKKAYEDGLTLIHTKANNDRTNFDKSVKEEQKQNQEAFDNDIDKLRKQTIDKEISDVEKAAKKEDGIKLQQVEDGKITQAQYNDWRVLQEQDTAKKIADIKQKAFEDEVNMYADQIEKIGGFLKQMSDQKLSNLEAEYADKEEKNKNALEQGLITQAQYDERTANLEKEKNKKIKTEKEKAWKVQHAVDIANAVADAAIAVSKVFAEEPGELIIKSAAAGIAAVIAAGNVALIASQKMPKFAKGGMVYGNSHAQGGVVAELEGGEFIINKNAMRNPGVASIVSSLNTPSPIPGSIYSNGVSSQASPIQASVDTNAIAQAVIDAIQYIPVILPEADITRTQKRVKMLETDSLIG